VTIPAVLVVEDNPTARKLLRLTLEAEGYRVLEAPHARQALALAQSEAPELVLLDLVLPDMDGLALARSIRALPRAASLPIVAVSGFRRLLDAARAEAGVVDAVLLKPVTAAELLSVVSGFVSQPAPEPLSTTSGERRTILVVDDDPLQLKLTRVRLELEGFRVVTALDGSSALEQARATVPDAVLCDVLMPGTDGYELCQALRREPLLAHVPVVLASAHFGGQRDEELARQVGASALVTRTPEIHDLVVAVRQAIARGPDAEVASRFPDTEHNDRILAQLKRQARANAGWAERSALQAAQLAILAGIGDALASSEDVQEALVDVLAACLDAGGVSCGALYRSDAREQLVFARSVGFPEGTEPSLREVFGYPELLLRAREGKLVAPAACLNEADVAAFLERSGTSAAVLVPLLRERRCIGVLLLGSTLAEIDESDLAAFGRAIGTSVAQALAMAGAIARLRDAAEASRVLNASLDPRQTYDAFGALATQSLADACELRLNNAETLVYTAAGAEPLAADGAGPAHSLTAELVAHGRPFGTVTLRRAPTRQPFEELDRVFARDLILRAATAMDNARLYEGAQQANRQKDEFLSTLSHELRTPLTAIIGWSHLLSRGSLEDTKRRHAIAVIERNATAQAQLIEDLLDSASIMSGKLRLKLRLADFRQVVDAALDAVRPTLELKRIELRCVAPEAGLELLADPDRLQQLVWNLLGNAIKFTPEGGSIEVRLRRAGGEAEFCVRDTGAGIDAAFLPHVFERFEQADGSFTREHGGLGLGLAITRHLVELHGGTIEAQSDGKGRGACFTVRLPVRSARISSAPPSESAVIAASALGADRSGQLRDLSILVVDDHQDNRELIAALLEQCGARARCAASCAEALEAFGVGHPDILLSDIGMPHEDGLTLIRKVRALPETHGGSVPAVAFSGYARPEDRSRAVSAGYSWHLPKPIDPLELIAVVASLSRPGQRAAPVGFDGAANDAS
jgi:CheY-like chemotaxis protein/signal transduction histidine kinase